MDKYVIGIDYGSDSCRSIILNTKDGKEVAGAVFNYPRWSKGLYCNSAKNVFRHHPLDYIEGLEYVIKEALKSIDKMVIENIVGISVDTTGSTPAPMDKDGNILALRKEFQNNPNAMFVLWKDHSSIKEADEINYTARKKSKIDYTKYVGGVYSSEWFWAKALHVSREDKLVKKEAYTWIELCDWITAYITGEKDPSKIKRGRCAAGHKGMWNENFNGYPPSSFFNTIDPLLVKIRESLPDNTYTSEECAGIISKEFAKKVGLPEDVKIGIGSFDAHMGAVGAGIKSYSLVKIMGTSTCDILIAPKKDVGKKVVKGICGQVDGSVIKNMIGMEAGQSAYGDFYAWFKNILLYPLSLIDKSVSTNDKELLVKELSSKILPAMENEIAKIETKEDSIVILDWINGRRTPFANQKLKSSFEGLNLSSSAIDIYKAILESTAFGTRKIIERFEDEGIKIKEVIATGGVAKKSSVLMQILANVINRPIKVTKSLQTVARGAAILAAVSSGIYKDVYEAQKYMLEDFEKEYKPNKKEVAVYEVLYKRYNALSEYVEKETMKESDIKKGKIKKTAVKNKK